MAGRRIAFIQNPSARRATFSKRVSSLFKKHHRVIAAAKDLEGEEKLEKLCNDNRKKEMIEIMFQCLNGTADVSHMSMLDLQDLTWMADDYRKKIKFLFGNCGPEPDVVPFVDGEAEDLVSSNKEVVEEHDSEKNN